MTDKEFNSLKRTLARLLIKWQYNLGFRHWDVHYDLVRDYHDESRDICADSSVSWEYMEIVIRFYGHKLSGKTEQELEEVIVHEFAHGLVGELRPGFACCSKNEDQGKHEERVVTMIANAILWSYQDGFEKGSKDVKGNKKSVKPKRVE